MAKKNETETEVPALTDEEEIAAKMAAGLTREQATEVQANQRAWDKQQEAK